MKARAILNSLLHGGNFTFNVSLCTTPFPIKRWNLPGLSLFVKVLQEKNVPSTLLSSQIKELIDLYEPDWITYEEKYL